MSKEVHIPDITAEGFVLKPDDPLTPGLIRLWALMKHYHNAREEDVVRALGQAQAIERAFNNTYVILASRRNQISKDFDRIFMTMTEGRDEHPEDWEESCDCITCRSYL